MPTIRVVSLLSLALLYASAASGQGRPTVVERGPAPIFISGVDMVTINGGPSFRRRLGPIERLQALPISLPRS